MGTAAYPQHHRRILGTTNFTRVSSLPILNTMYSSNLLRTQATRLMMMKPTQALKIQPSLVLKVQPTRSLMMKPTEALKLQRTQHLQMKPTRPLMRPTPVGQSVHKELIWKGSADNCVEGRAQWDVAILGQHSIYRC